MTVDSTAIRKLRERFGWSQAELARRLGTDAGTVSRWERGVTRPRAAHRSRLLALLGQAEDASLDELIRLVGAETAKRVLRRHILLRWRPAGAGEFGGTGARHTPSLGEDAEARLRAAERARAQQRELKELLRGDG
ncbi:MAG: helix-turn-helix domain-containing protein [Deltaproteobacteria bacterium]|nr:MAG: helix-turn-helix domain-containing protein [Deltaproteobacteria bacterium]